MISTQPLLLPDVAQAASEKRTNPGVIVLTHQGQLLYLNHEATELCAEINQARLGQVARGVLPIEVVNLCHAIAEKITVVQDVKAWEGTHIRLMIADLAPTMRSEEHTSELQSRLHLVCRLLLEKKKSSCKCEFFRRNHGPKLRLRQPARN